MMMILYQRICRVITGPYDDGTVSEDLWSDN